MFDGIKRYFGRGDFPLRVITFTAESFEEVKKDLAIVSGRLGLTDGSDPSIESTGLILKNLSERTDRMYSDRTKLENTLILHQRLNQERNLEIPERLIEDALIVARTLGELRKTAMDFSQHGAFSVTANALGSVTEADKSSALKTLKWLVASVDHAEDTYERLVAAIEPNVSSLNKYQASKTN